MSCTCTCGLPLRCLLPCSLPPHDHKLTKSQPTPKKANSNSKSFSNRLNRLVRPRTSNQPPTIKPYTPATASSSKPVGARPAGPLPVPIMEIILLSYSLHATSWSASPSPSPAASSSSSSQEASTRAQSVVSSDALTNWLNARWRKTGYQVSHEEVYVVLRANGVNAEMARGDRLDGAFYRGIEDWECL